MLHINLPLRAQDIFLHIQGALLKKIIKFLASRATFFPSVAGTLQKHATCSHQANLLVKIFNYKVTSSLIFTNLIKPTGPTSLMQLNEICTAPKQYRVPKVHELLTGYSPRTVQSRTVVFQLISPFTNSFCVRIFTGVFVKFFSSGPGLCSLSLVIVVEMQRAMWIWDNETTSSDFTSTQKWRQSMSN